jgi:hypothetical protein
VSSEKTLGFATTDLVDRNLWDLQGSILQTLRFGQKVF